MVGGERERECAGMSRRSGKRAGHARLGLGFQRNFPSSYGLTLTQSRFAELFLPSARYRAHHHAVSDPGLPGQPILTSWLRQMSPTLSTLGLAAVHTYVFFDSALKLVYVDHPPFQSHSTVYSSALSCIVPTIRSSHQLTCFCGRT